MENKTFSLNDFDCNTQEIIRKPLNHLRDSNLSVKADMADDLQKMGIPASAISRLLNITYHRRIKL